MEFYIKGIPGSLWLTEVSCCKLLRVIKSFLGIPPKYNLWYKGYGVPGVYQVDIDGKTLFECRTGRVVSESYLLEALDVRFEIYYPGIPEVPLIIEKHTGSDLKSLVMRSWNISDYVIPEYDVYYGGLIQVPGRYWYDKDTGELLVRDRTSRKVLRSSDILDLLGLEE